MRVIAGRFKGRHLVSFQADHVRPTTDRIKESIFNKLQFEIDGARVLDLFSGTGSLAIEALSRGAVYVEAVESHRISLNIIRENLEKLGVSSEIQLIRHDVFKYLQKYTGDGFDVILIDPPFTEKLADDVMRELASSAVVRDNTIIMLESSSHEKIEISYGLLNQRESREYGDKVVSFYSLGGEE